MVPEEMSSGEAAEELAAVGDVPVEDPAWARRPIRTPELVEEAADPMDAWTAAKASVAQRPAPVSADVEDWFAEENSPVEEPAVVEETTPVVKQRRARQASERPERKQRPERKAVGPKPEAAPEPIVEDDEDVWTAG